MSGKNYIYEQFEQWPFPKGDFALLKLYVWIYFAYLFSSGELSLRAFLHLKSLLLEIISHVLCIRKQNTWREGEEEVGRSWKISGGQGFENEDFMVLPQSY